MQQSKALKFAFIIGTSVTTLLIVAPQAQATPELAKGKACSTCHSGTPPSMKNVKKKDDKKMDGAKK